MATPQTARACLSAAKAPDRTGPRKGDRWIPWLFVLFFLVIAAVDGVLVTIAVTTNTGVVTEDAYQKGLKFNDFLSEAAAQNALGVSQKAAFADGALTWTLKDKSGRAINGAHVKARFYRPAKDGNDFETTLEAKDGGTYSARPSFPAPGLWVARLEAQWRTPSLKSETYKTSLDIVAR